MKRLIATTLATLAIATASIGGYIVGNTSTEIVETNLSLVTLESTPSNPLVLINTGRVDSNGSNAEYYCHNNDTTIHHLTGYKVLRNNSHHIISDRVAPGMTMPNLVAGAIASICTGWTLDN